MKGFTLLEVMGTILMVIVVVLCAVLGILELARVIHIGVIWILAPAWGSAAAIGVVVVCVFLFRLIQGFWRWVKRQGWHL